MNKLRKLGTFLFWAPAWYMTRIIVWRMPEHSWTRTVDIYMLAACATPLFRQITLILWVLIIEWVGALTYFFMRVSP